MPKVSINIIKDWFKNQMKPPQEQFWAWLDSFWHKDEAIPQSAVENLVTTLQKKADLVNGVVPEDQLPFSVVTSEVITLGAVTIVDNSVNLAVHSSGENKVRVKGKTIVRTFPNSWIFTPIEDNGVKVIRGYAVKNEDDFFIAEGEELPEDELPEIPAEALEIFKITISAAGVIIDDIGEIDAKLKGEDTWRTILLNSNTGFFIPMDLSNSLTIEKTGLCDFPKISGISTKFGKYVRDGQKIFFYNNTGVDLSFLANVTLPVYPDSTYINIGEAITVKDGEYLILILRAGQLWKLNIAGGGNSVIEIDKLNF